MLRLLNLRKAERELENILNDVSKIIANAVSEQIKVPQEILFGIRKAVEAKVVEKVDVLVVLVAFS